MTPKWYKDAVVYQIYPMSFQDSNGDGIGDLNGIRKRLPYIHNLGANVIWLNPIYKSPDEDNGYDIADYRSIQPAYGNMDDFDALLKDIHSRGMKLLMDLVVNHTSDQHEWFKKSRQSKDNPYSDFYIWRDPVNGHEPNNWGSEFSGSAWSYEPKRGQYYLHCFSKGQPDLNWENPEVRHQVYEIMRFWLDKGIDGFRMDVINHISKPKGLPNGKTKDGEKYVPSDQMVANGPKLADYLREMNEKVLSHYNVMTVGEMPNTEPKDAVKYANEDGSRLNMIFQFEHVGLTPNPDSRLGKWNDNPVPLVDLKHSLSRWQNGLEGKSWNSLYWNNHDQPRAVSRFSNDSPQYRERAAKMLGTTLHMLKGTPYVYEGEELGMTNAHYNDIHQYHDIESINAYHQLVEEDKAVDPSTMMRYLANMSRDNARTVMQWNNYQKNAGFSNSNDVSSVNTNTPEINAHNEMKEPSSVFNYYKQLIRLRYNEPIIRYGNYEELDPKDDKVFAYRRHYKNETLLVISNFTEENVSRDYDQKDADELLITNYNDAYINDPLTDLRPYETKVYVFNAKLK